MSEPTVSPVAEAVALAQRLNDEAAQMEAASSALRAATRRHRRAAEEFQSALADAGQPAKQEAPKKEETLARRDAVVAGNKAALDGTMPRVTAVPSAFPMPEGPPPAPITEPVLEAPPAPKSEAPKEAATPSRPTPPAGTNGHAPPTRRPRQRAAAT